MPKKVKEALSDEREERRLLAESDLEEFIKLVHPKRYLGNIHREVIRWWTRPEAKSHQLLLLPRDHMKSALIAYRAAWTITKDPTVRILYISSTSQLATKQLKFIKDILTNDTYRMFWPDMVEKEDAKREKWTEREIAVDHPLRKEWNIRDATVITAGLTSNIVGLHCDVAVLDDVVVQGNAYTEDGREKVKDQYSFLSSIEGADAKEWSVGTRYHPKDLYSDLLSMEAEQYDENGKLKDADTIYEVFERQVESVGDGTGEFLWPRTKSPDGKWFGFDAQVLADKRGKYLNKLHFRAQYYNDPHDVDSSPIQRSQFQYYNQQFLNQVNGRWEYNGNRLNVFAAVDFAYSTSRRSDYSSIVVVGVDTFNNYYVLDIDRFRSDGSPSTYFKHILDMHQKWGFRKIRVEVSVAQIVIAKSLKEDYIRPLGLGLAIEEFRPTAKQGSKQERILATLEPKYANNQIWHYPSGNCQILEEELLYANPAHDDVKDALASCIDCAEPPTNMFKMIKQRIAPFQFHSRFGGTI